MLEIYYDDSGTHSANGVVVWGGVAGHTQYLNEFKQAWGKLLMAPCEGKPPIKKFSSYDLFHAKKEFEGYNEAERNLTRRNFRQVIVDAGLSVLSYGISAGDWDELIIGIGRAALRSPETTILSLAIKGGCDCGVAEGSPVAFVFDAGCSERADIPLSFKNGVASSDIDPDKVSYDVSPVLGNAALQAADLVAHETYQMFMKYQASGDVVPSAHLQRLRSGVHDFHAKWVGRHEIEKLVARSAEMLTELGVSET